MKATSVFCIKVVTGLMDEDHTILAEKYRDVRPEARLAVLAILNELSIISE